MASWFETLFDESYIAFYEELQDREVAAKDQCQHLRSRFHRSHFHRRCHLRSLPQSRWPHRFLA